MTTETVSVFTDLAAWLVKHMGHDVCHGPGITVCVTCQRILLFPKELHDISRGVSHG